MIRIVVSPGNPGHWIDIDPMMIAVAHFAADGSAKIGSPLFPWTSATSRRFREIPARAKGLLALKESLASAAAAAGDLVRFAGSGNTLFLNLLHFDAACLPGPSDKEQVARFHYDGGDIDVTSHPAVFAKVKRAFPGSIRLKDGETAIIAANRLAHADIITSEKISGRHNFVFDDGTQFSLPSKAADPDHLLRAIRGKTFFAVSSGHETTVIDERKVAAASLIKSGDQTESTLVFSPGSKAILRLRPREFRRLSLKLGRRLRTIVSGKNPVLIDPARTSIVEISVSDKKSGALLRSPGISLNIGTVGVDCSRHWLDGRLEVALTPVEAHCAIQAAGKLFLAGGAQYLPLPPMKGRLFGCIRGGALAVEPYGVFKWGGSTVFWPDRSFMVSEGRRRLSKDNVELPAIKVIADGGPAWISASAIVLADVNHSWNVVTVQFDDGSVINIGIKDAKSQAKNLETFKRLRGFASYEDEQGTTFISENARFPCVETDGHTIAVTGMSNDRLILRDAALVHFSDSAPEAAERQSEGDLPC